MLSKWHIRAKSLSSLEVCRAIQKVLFHVEMDVPDHGDLLFCRSNYIRNVFEWSHSEKCGLKDDLLSHNGTIWYGFAINFSFWDFLKPSPQLEGHASMAPSIRISSKTRGIDSSRWVLVILKKVHEKIPSELGEKWMRCFFAKKIASREGSDFALLNTNSELTNFHHTLLNY